MHSEEALQTEIQNVIVEIMEGELHHFTEFIVLVLRCGRTSHIKNLQLDCMVVYMFVSERIPYSQHFTLE